MAPTEASNMSAVNASKPQRVITFVYMWFSTFVTCVGPCLYCLGVQACLLELYLIELSFSHLRRVGVDSRLDLLMLIDFIGFYWSRLCWLTLINGIKGFYFYYHIWCNLIMSLFSFHRWCNLGTLCKCCKIHNCGCLTIE